jgi:hypothetical protein
MSPVKVSQTGTQWAELAAAQLQNARTATMAGAKSAMQEAMAAGKEIAQQRIHDAVTMTGAARAAEGGGSAGRVDKGGYHNNFGFETSPLSPDRMTGRYGWLNGGPAAHADPQSYYELQESGFQNVESVHALLDATEITKGEFRKRLTEFVRKEFS